MRFSILSLGWCVVYVAAALCTLGNPTSLLSELTVILWQLTVALSLVLAFHLRSTPYFSFAIFNVIAILNPGLFDRLTIPIMLGLGVTTGAAEYDQVQSMLFCHAAFTTGVVGFFIGIAISRFVKTENALEFSHFKA